MYSSEGGVSQAFTVAHCMCCMYFTSGGVSYSLKLPRIRPSRLVKRLAEVSKIESRWRSCMNVNTSAFVCYCIFTFLSLQLNLFEEKNVQQKVLLSHLDVMCSCN